MQTPNSQQVEIEQFASQKTSKHLFNFDYVFNKSATQADVYEEVEPLVKSFLDGNNVCIFSYGQTGSGKTFTMGTDSSRINCPDLQGIVPRAVQ